MDVLLQCLLALRAHLSDVWLLLSGLSSQAGLSFVNAFSHSSLL